jgi:predicted Zn-dependent protease with MMP-like domain
MVIKQLVHKWIDNNHSFCSEYSHVFIHEISHKYNSESAIWDIWFILSISPGPIKSI